MGDDPGSELTPAELRDLRRLAGFMVPSSTDYRVPGADDAAIFADIVRSLGRDRNDVRKALAMLREHGRRRLRRHRRGQGGGDGDGAARASRDPRSRHSGGPCCNATTATTA